MVPENTTYTNTKPLNEQALRHHTRSPIHHQNWRTSLRFVTIQRPDEWQKARAEPRTENRRSRSLRLSGEVTEAA